MSENKKKKGFAAMDPEKQREIASLGGKSAHLKCRAHEFTTEEAKEAGRKGGAAIKKRGSEYFAEIGRRGGLKVSANKEHMTKIGQQGGFAVSRDRKHMAEIGRKGGAVHSSVPAPAAE